MAKSPESITQTEAAKRLERTTSYVRVLTAQGVLSRNLDRSYPWPKIREEYNAFLAPKPDPQKPVDPLEEQRIRLTRSKADAAELELRLRRGELVELTDVEALLRGPLERANAVLKNAPSKYGAKLARRSKLRLPEARALLSEIIESVRAELRATGSGDANAA